ncbi:hypothetical protein T03_7777 [Trichinella britovi]|uniref:Uncharacterized protein n=1 Tax=Trichinella britovi TaxID=45882 RepID=A0A0V1C7R6_TRIBR|nr:hypothetical protein T03_7777 [Trichinella britovi]
MSNKQIKSGIIEFCEMANMPEMGLEIFNAGGGWRDQKWAPSWSVKLPSLRQGRVQTLPCSLGRQSARSSSLERGKPRLSALKRRVRLSCFTCLRCAGSLVLFPAPRGGEIVRFVCPTEAAVKKRAKLFSTIPSSISKVGSVGKEIYISLTEEERQYHIMVGKVLQHRNNIMRIRALIPRFRSV